MIDHYRSWLKKKPGDRLAMYGLALELKKAGDPAARVAFEELLEAHPHSGAGWFQFGQWFEEQDEEDEAIATWRRGLVALEDADATDVEAKRSIVELQSAIDALE